MAPRSWSPVVALGTTGLQDLAWPRGAAGCGRDGSAPVGAAHRRRARRSAPARRPSTLGPATVKAAGRAAQDRARRGEIAPAEVADAAVAALPERAASLRPVINATGVMVHTNLGRAPLSRRGGRRRIVAAAGHTDVEFDLATGQRARRGRGALAALAAAVPDAEAVHVVNNGAAALVLAAAALAAGREIVVSRGEMVEIGDGFRLPDLLESTGARLREVGTTNRTTLADYAAAIGRGHRLRAQGPPVELRGRAASPSAVPASPTLAGLRRAGGRRHRLRPARARSAAARRAGRRHGAARGADLVTRQRRQAARRPAGRPAARRRRAGRAAAPAPAGPRAAGRQADPGRAGGDAARSGRRRPGRRFPPTRRACGHGRSGSRDRRAAGVPAESVSHVAVVGGGGAPGVELPSWALSLPDSVVLASCPTPSSNTWPHPARARGRPDFPECAAGSAADRRRSPPHAARAPQRRRRARCAAHPTCAGTFPPQHQDPSPQGCRCIEGRIVIAGPGRHDERAVRPERVAKRFDQSLRPALDRSHRAKRCVHEQHAAFAHTERAQLRGDGLARECGLGHALFILRASPPHAAGRRSSIHALMSAITPLLADIVEQVVEVPLVELQRLVLRAGRVVEELAAVPARSPCRRCRA